MIVVMGLKVGIGVVGWMGATYAGGRAYCAGGVEAQDCRDANIQIVLLSRANEVSWCCISVDEGEGTEPELELGLNVSH